ncbi:DUF6232 family protein [Streptomyces sp. NBC_00878]|uniref:DUF6232 family protein n=1 Tax=Streptomyces sp. NBC_00878 TaxID=2975854 RepID=UPI002258AF15|nr:DUF6232 family protein [Streptomyces sp. NBC_00878]MCX4906217.1 DUF6232 family protein [Streptomyces sp. NBC_00878]
MSKGALWVGSDTYPLRNIARTSMKQLVPDRAKAKTEFVKKLVLHLVLVFAGLGFMSASTFVGLLLLAVGAGLIARSFHRLQQVLNAPTLYVLEITTSGSPQTALTSDDQGLMDKVFQQVMEAMDNPEIQFRYEMPTYNISSGDNIYQFGDNNTGKVTR